MGRISRAPPSKTVDASEIMEIGTLNLANFSANFPSREDPTLLDLMRLAFEDPESDVEHETTEDTDDESWDQRYEPVDVDFMFDRREYIADSLDRIYVNNIKAALPETKITLKALEDTFDRLEKIQEFETWKTGKELVNISKKDNFLPDCEVCGGKKEKGNNRLVSCSICFMKIHQECYGLPYTPLSEYKCRRCLCSPITTISCILCPHGGGAIKYTTDNQVVHQICLSWLEGTWITGNCYLDPVNIEEVMRERGGVRCDTCLRTEGRVATCAWPTCNYKTHVTCAAIAQFNMGVEVEVNKKEVQSRKKKIYCGEHSAMSIDEIKRAKAKVQQSLEINHADYSYISLRPLREKYFDKHFRHPKINDDDFERLHRYWELKKLKRFGDVLIPRLAIIHNRLLLPSRQLIDDAPPINYDDVKKRITLESSNHRIEILADFRTIYGFEIPLNYFVPPAKGDTRQPYLDYEGQSISFDAQKLFINTVPLVDQEVEILLCRREPDISRVVLALFNTHIDSTTTWSMKDDYAPLEPIGEWDIIGLMYYTLMPIQIQIYTFLCGLWCLDHAHMFIHFNYRSPNAVNLRTMTQKALFKKYKSLKDVYDDFHLMMLPLNSPTIKPRRQRYGRLFEEAACYLMAPENHLKILNTLIKKIKDPHATSLVIRYLLERFVQHNIKSRCIPEVKAAALFAKNMIESDKKQPLPDPQMIKKLLNRRKIQTSKPLIFQFQGCGLPYSISHRIFAICELPYVVNFKRISWNDCSKMIQERQDRYVTEVINKENAIKALKRRKLEDKLHEVVAKKARINGAMSDTENNPHHVYPPSTQVRNLEQNNKAREKNIPSTSANIKNKKRVIPKSDRVTRSTKAKNIEVRKQRALERKKRAESSRVEINPMEFDSSRVVVGKEHEVAVVVKTGKLGDNFAALMVRPNIENPSHYVAVLHNSQKNSRSCFVEYFSNSPTSECVSIDNVSRINFVELFKFFEANKGKMDAAHPRVNSFRLAYKWYTDKFF